MNDRELLELAAKAAGYKVVGNFGLGLPKTGGLVLDSGSAIFGVWNPLEDDGDALRLANQLKLCVCHTLCEVTKAHGTVMAGYTPWENTSPISTERYAGLYDRDKAVRRAIVSAAAELGRSMQ